jgi:1,4-alpha-glucan branching enzyme
LACWLVGVALAVSSTVTSAEPVTFRLRAPGAREVLVTGSFSAWQGRRALQPAGAFWETTIDVQPGRYEYFFLVDGRPTVNPDVPSLPDGFGGRNNVLVVPGTR